MNTVQAGTGPESLGYESMYIVFVFKNEMALKQFIGAKGGGGDIGASATLGIIGEQISFNLKSVFINFIVMVLIYKPIRVERYICQAMSLND